MADSKISALPSATTPLAGTEVLPIVQSSTTDKITVNSLAAGNLKSQTTTGVLQVTGPTAAAVRVMTAPDANFTVARTDAGQTFTGTNNFGAVSVTPATGTAVTVQGLDNEWLAVLKGTATGTSYGFRMQAGLPTAPAASVVLIKDGTNTNTYFQIKGDGTSFLGYDTTLSTGNLIQGTAAKGINFTANTPAAGVTSQLLNWYEEGTWTPTVVGSTSAGTGTYTVQQAHYIRIGKCVQFTCALGWSAHTGTGDMQISGLPFAVPGGQDTAPCSVFSWGLTFTGQLTAVTSSSSISMYQIASNSAASAVAMDAAVPALNVSGFYFVS